MCKKKNQRLRNLWDKNKTCDNNHVIRVPEGKGWD